MYTRFHSSFSSFLYQHFYFLWIYVAQALGYGLLNPYLQAFNSNFTCGANFSMANSKAVDDGTNLFPFPIQLTQFKYFLSQTISNQTSNLGAGTPISLSLSRFLCIYICVYVCVCVCVCVCESSYIYGSIHPLITRFITNAFIILNSN